MIDLQKNNNSNCLPILLLSGILKSQVPALVCKDFCYQELTNKRQPFYPTQPIRRNAISYDPHIYGPRAFTSDGSCCVGWCHFFYLTINLREKRSVPLTKWSGTACFQNLCGTLVGNRCLKRRCLLRVDHFQRQRFAHHRRGQKLLEL